MANYYGTGRSNYVRVKDEEAFRRAAERLDCEVVTDQEGRFAILDDNPDGGGFSFIEYPDEPDAEPVEHVVEELLGPLLADGEVMVLMEAGHEKHRYVTGWAMAFNNRQEVRRVDLDDIYELARQLGTSVTSASY